MYPSQGVMPKAALFFAERGTLRGALGMRARSLGPLVKTRAFGMTPPYRRRRVLI